MTDERDGLPKIPLGDNCPEPVYPEDDPEFWNDQDVRQDFTGSISGFDFPFDPSILATQSDFGAGMIRMPRSKRAEYLKWNGREDEAFQSDD